MSPPDRRGIARARSPLIPKSDEMAAMVALPANQKKAPIRPQLKKAAAGCSPRLPGDRLEGQRRTNRSRDQTASLPANGMPSPASSETSFETGTEVEDSDEGGHVREETGGKGIEEQVQKSEDDLGTTSVASGGNNTPSSSSTPSQVSQAGSRSSGPPASTTSGSRFVAPQPLHETASVNSDLLDELRDMIKQEIAGHLKTQGPGSISPSHVSRITPALMNSMFPGAAAALPSPPLSVIAASNSSKLSSPDSTSPTLAHAVPATLASPSSLSGQRQQPSGAPERPTVRFSNRRPPMIHSHSREAGTSTPTSMSSSLEIAKRPEAVAGVEQDWGIFFDSRGYATKRLGRVLRALAKLVIADFGSGTTGDLLFTPDVLHTLYLSYKTQDDEFPYHEVFKSAKTSNLDGIENLYQSLDLPYHLVQSAPKSHPSVPGLSPSGFARWLTLNILAYPDQEYVRLNRILADLPPLQLEDRAGDAKASDERLPRCLPRCLPRVLFPSSHDRKTRRMLDEALLDCLEKAGAVPGFGLQAKGGHRGADETGAGEYVLSRPLEDKGRRQVTTPGDRQSTPRSFRAHDDIESIRQAPRVVKSLDRRAEEPADKDSHEGRHDLPPPPVGRHHSRVHEIQHSHRESNRDRDFDGRRRPSSPLESSYIASSPNASRAAAGSLVPSTPFSSPSAASSTRESYFSGPSNPRDSLLRAASDNISHRPSRSSCSSRSGRGRGRAGDRERDGEREAAKDPRRESSALGGPTWDDYYRKGLAGSRPVSAERKSGGRRGSRE